MPDARPAPERKKARTKEIAPEVVRPFVRALHTLQGRLPKPYGLVKNDSETLP